MKNFVASVSSFLFLGLAAILLPIAAAAQTFTGTGFTIVDGGGRVPESCSTVAVSGITTDVTVRSVTINNLNHTWIGDTQTMVYRPGAATPPAFGDTISSPPDDRACNFLGTYKYIDIGAQTIDAATTGPCASATNVAPGNYRSSNYFGVTGAGGPPTSLATNFGTLTPAQANGNWLVCVFDYVTPDGGTVGSTSLQLLGPTAAGVEVGGRVTTGRNRGLVNATVTMTDAGGVSRTTRTTTFGYFRFADVQAGGSYIFTVTSKTYQFSPQVITVSEDLSELNFSPQFQ